MNRNIFKFALAAGLALSLSACFAQEESETAVETTELAVRFPIPIVENGQSGFYLALDRGYYAEEGLDITFNMGSPELNPVAMVASGQDQIGVLGGPDTLLVARSRGTPLTAFAILHRNSNFPVVIVRDDSPIRTVQDLEGKRVGFNYGHISTDVLRAFFKQSGVEVEEVDTGFDYAPLITGRVDAEWGFTVTAGIDLPASGQPIRMINPADSGIVSHGYTLFAREDYIDANRDVIARFTRATLRGVRDAVNEPQAAVDALMERNPELDPAITMQRQLAYNAVTTRNAGGFYFGYIDDQMMSSTYDRLNDLGVLEGEFDFRRSFVADIARDNQPE